MSANGGLSEEKVRSEIGRLECSPNGPKSQSSPIYGTRKMPSSGRSSAGNDKESGFQGAPNTQKGKAHRR